MRRQHVCRFGVALAAAWLELSTLAGVAAHASAVQRSVVESPEPRLTLLFQALRFNSPTDDFYLVDFDPARGTMSEPKAMKLGDALGFAVPRTLEGSERPVFLLSDRSSGYELLYEHRPDGRHQRDRYRYVFLRTSDHSVAWAVHGSVRADIQGDSALYTTGLELKERWLGSGSEGVIARRLRSFAVRGDELWLFYADGRVAKRRAGKESLVLQLPRKYVAGAGVITPRWLWFYLRANEKAPGDLWVWDTQLNRRQKVGPGWQQGRLLLVLPKTP